MSLRKVLIGVLVLMTAYLQSRLWIGESSFAHVSALTGQVERKTAENESRRERNRILQAEVHELKNGLESIEEKARSELGMIKEGETFYLLIEDS